MHNYVAMATFMILLKAKKARARVFNDLRQSSKGFLRLSRLHVSFEYPLKQLVVSGTSS